MKKTGFAKCVANCDVYAFGHYKGFGIAATPRITIDEKRYLFMRVILRHYYVRRQRRLYYVTIITPLLPRRYNFACRHQSLLARHFLPHFARPSGTGIGSPGLAVRRDTGHRRPPGSRDIASLAWHRVPGLRPAAFILSPPHATRRHRVFEWFRPAAASLPLLRSTGHIAGIIVVAGRRSGPGICRRQCGPGQVCVGWRAILILPDRAGLQPAAGRLPACRWPGCRARRAFGPGRRAPFRAGPGIAGPAPGACVLLRLPGRAPGPARPGPPGTGRRASGRPAPSPCRPAGFCRLFPAVRELPGFRAPGIREQLYICFCSRFPSRFPQFRFTGSGPFY